MRSSTKFSSSSLWGRSGEVVLRFLDFGISFLSQVLDSISSVKSSSDLFISVHKSFELNVEVLVLALEHVAVGVESTDLGLHVVVSLEEAVVAEAEVVLFLSGDVELVFNLSLVVFSCDELVVKITVFGVLTISLSL